MAIVQNLVDGERPRDAWCVLVENDPSRGNETFMTDMMVHGSGATFYVPNFANEAQRRSTIDQATAWADNNGAATVYVKA